MTRSWLRLFRLPWNAPERDVDAELRFHFDERVAELVAGGAAPADAHARAIREFGDPTAVRSELIAIDRRTARRQTRRSTFEAMTHPFIAAARRLSRQPVFFALTAGSLALALGATTAAFGFADAWIHPTLAFEAPDRTATVIMWGGPDAAHGGMSSLDRWHTMEHAPSFERVAFEQPDNGRLQIGDETSLGGYFAVTTNYFDVLGVRPRIGRAFLPGPADDDAVIVSDPLWRRSFANRPDIGDAAVTIDGRTYKVIGILPRGVRGGFVYADVWRRFPDGQEKGFAWPVVRFKPGATQASVQGELDAIAAVVNAHNAYKDRPYGFGVHMIASDDAAHLANMHYLMMFVAVFILFIACANVSALLLARAASRRRDLALRLSLGAGRRALVTDVIAELTIIAGVGLVLGLAAAYGSNGIVRALIPPELTWVTFVEISWSWRLYAIAGAALLFVIAVAGFLPALQVSRIPPIEPLKESSAASTARGPQRMKSVVMLQLAVSLTMLIATSQLIRSVAQLSNFDFGFDPRRVIEASGNFVYKWNSDKLGGLTATQYMLPRATAAKGVTMTSYYGSGRPDGYQIASDDIARDGHPLLASQYTIAGPHFLQTLGIPLVEGRDFVEGDDAGAGAVILDDSAAKELFPTGSAVGRRVKLGRATSNEPWRPVIGVARSIALRFPATRYPANWPGVYVAMPQPDARRFNVVARTDRAEDTPITALRVRREMASGVPLSVQVIVAPLSASHDQSLHFQEQLAKLFGSLALGALLFAAAGLFAVLSYMVSQRMREFGIRVAIGAQRGDVARLVFRDALELALGGTAIGGMAGIGLTVVFSPQLLDVDYVNVLPLVSAEAVLIAVTLLASLAPVFRAIRADPVDVLRAS